MKVGDLLSKFAAKAGINLADEKYKDLSLVIASSNAEIADEIATKISGSLMNMDDARNNIDLKKHFTAAVYDGMDSTINDLMDELGFEVQDREIVKAEQSTTKKQGALARQIKALEEKKAAARGSDKAELQAQINAKTNQIVELQKRHDEEIKALKSDYEARMTNKEIRLLLKGKKWANDQIDPEINEETALIMANRKLAESGAKIVNVNGKMVLKQSKDESLDWLSPANETPTVEQFFDGVLAQSKLLAVSSAAGPNPGNPPLPPIPGGSHGQGNQSVVSANDAAIKALEAAVPV